MNKYELQDIREAYNKDGEPLLIQEQTPRYKVTNNGRPPIFKKVSLKQLQQRADEYIQLQREKEEPCTMIGLAHAIGVSRETLYKYINTNAGKFTDILKYYKEMVENNILTGALGNKYNSGFSQFVLTNHHDYKNSKDVNIKKHQDIKIISQIPDIQEVIDVESAQEA